MKGEIQVPDIWVEYTVSDLINGKDPYFETVKREIENESSH